MASKRNLIRTALGIFIIAGATMLVLRPLDAGVQDDAVTAKTIDPDSLRDTPLSGDTWVLDRTKTRGWSAVQGTMREQLASEDPAGTQDFVVWDANYVLSREGTVHDAWVDRVLLNHGLKGRMHISDQRFAPCREVTGDSGTSRVQEIGGSTHFEPRQDEMAGLTNHEGVNRLLAPGYWIRARLEVNAESVEVVGTEEVAGREAYKTRFENGGVPEDQAAATVLWIDKERGVVLRWVNEGRAPKHPGASEISAYRQVWEFTSIAFDDEVERLSLDDIAVPPGERVRFGQLNSELDVRRQNEFVAKRGDTLASVVEREGSGHADSTAPKTTCPH